MDVVAAQTKAIAGNFYLLLLYYLSTLYETSICLPAFRTFYVFHQLLLLFNLGSSMQMLLHFFIAFTLYSQKIL
jgi:hypothetical protein